MLHHSFDIGRKQIIAMLLISVLAFTMSACGKEEDNIQKAQIPAIENETETAVSETAEAEQKEPSEQTADSLSFADLARLEFTFSSGAGGWATILSIHADGTFSGEYFDGEMGLTGEGYPNGTMYQSRFHGTFTQPVKVNDFTYSMQIQEVSYEKEPGTEEIVDGTLFCYGEAYGLTGAEEFLLYIPGSPLAELPEGYKSWVGYPDILETEETELPFFGIYNEAEECGFAGYDIVEGVTSMVETTGFRAAVIEESIKHNMLTQVEYNEKSQQLYEVWDEALNSIWHVLPKVLEADAMNALIVEERKWVTMKEEEVTKAGAAVADGSMQPMVMNMKAAELTEARVYELLELLE